MAASSKGSTSAPRALALRRLLAGEESAYRDAVLLNAAAALVIADQVSDLAEGAVLAANTIDSGAARRLLDAWIAYA